jgi:hypothetical protein
MSLKDFSAEIAKKSRDSSHNSRKNANLTTEHWIILALGSCLCVLIHIASALNQACGDVFYGFGRTGSKRLGLRHWGALKAPVWPLKPFFFCLKSR